MRDRTVIVLGGDGYLGWPQAMHLSNLGYRVIAVDNLVRRRWDLECGTSSLIPISTMERRVERWREEGKGDIEWRNVDLTDADALYRADRVHQARSRRPFRGAALGALLDDRPRARGDDPAQQRCRHPEPALRHPRARARTATS